MTSNKRRPREMLRAVDIAALLRALAGITPLFLLMALPAARAQTLTQVSATLTDPTGLPYSGAKVQIVLAASGSPVLSPCSPSPASNCAIQNPVAATTDAAGSFTVDLWANASILPAGSTYAFTVALSPGVPPPLGAGPVTFVVGGVTIAGATQSLSAALSAAAPAIESAIPVAASSAALNNWCTNGGTLWLAPGGFALAATCAPPDGSVLYLSQGTTITSPESPAFRCATGTSRPGCQIRLAGADIWTQTATIPAAVKPLSGAGPGIALGYWDGSANHDCETCTVQGVTVDMSATTQPAAVTASSISCASSVCTVTTTTAHGLNPTDEVRISGDAVTANNDIFKVESAPTSATFTVWCPLCSSSSSSDSVRKQRVAIQIEGAFWTRLQQVGWRGLNSGEIGILCGVGLSGGAFGDEQCDVDGANSEDGNGGVRWEGDKSLTPPQGVTTSSATNIQSEFYSVRSVGAFSADNVDATWNGNNAFPMYDLNDVNGAHFWSCDVESGNSSTLAFREQQVVAADVQATAWGGYAGTLANELSGAPTNRGTFEKSDGTFLRWGTLSLQGTLAMGAAALAQLGAFTVGTLPAASSNPGALAYVTDSTTVSAEGQACVGGSANQALAFSSGGGWKCF